MFVHACRRFVAWQLRQSNDASQKQILHEIRCPSAPGPLRVEPMVSTRSIY